MHAFDDNLDVILFTETWLHFGIKNSELCFSNYHIYIDVTVHMMFLKRVNQKRVILNQIVKKKISKIKKIVKKSLKRF